LGQGNQLWFWLSTKMQKKRTKLDLKALCPAIDFQSMIWMSAEGLVHSAKIHCLHYKNHINQLVSPCLQWLHSHSNHALRVSPPTLRILPPILILASHCCLCVITMEATTYPQQLLMHEQRINILAAFQNHSIPFQNKSWKNW